MYNDSMHIAILGRQPALGMAEIERLYSSRHTAWLSDISAKVTHPDFDFERLGGSQKAGRIVTEFPGLHWRQLSQKIIEYYRQQWRGIDHKITLGISVYGLTVSTYDIQRLGLDLKKVARNGGGSLRLIPNSEPALNTATSHHNKLGLSPNKVELLIVRASNGKIILAESIGAQNITAIAARDQARPKTDAFVGMLPPKLARMMVNMAAQGLGSCSLRPLHSEEPRNDTSRVILDPFCGTGVVLQEASLLGYKAYGTDLSEKMIDYSSANLAWLAEKYTAITPPAIELGDAMTHTWQQPINAVASETYLGQPFSAPPAHEKLIQVRNNCDHIIGEFLSNIGKQLTKDTPLCLAVPAWRDAIGTITHLPLTTDLARYGFEHITLTNVRADQLLYYRETQVVARQLLLIKKS